MRRERNNSQPFRQVAQRDGRMREFSETNMVVTRKFARLYLRTGMYSAVCRNEIRKEMAKFPRNMFRRIKRERSNLQRRQFTNLHWRFMCVCLHILLWGKCVYFHLKMNNTIFACSNLILICFLHLILAFVFYFQASLQMNPFKHILVFKSISLIR